MTRSDIRIKGKRQLHDMRIPGRIVRVRSTEQSVRHLTSYYMLMIRPVSAFTLCEIEITVLPSEARFSACSTSSSVWASRFAVISSNRRSFGFATAALAIDNSCHCPWEKISWYRECHSLFPIVLSSHPVPQFLQPPVPLPW